VGFELKDYDPASAPVVVQSGFIQNTAPDDYDIAKGLSFCKN
jgi:hypothetical protein|tara:strand:- start:231 stop:356 length:126 start_codon:yes stop_codon:yes gene_type:complete